MERSKLKLVLYLLHRISTILCKITSVLYMYMKYSIVKTFCLMTPIHYSNSFMYKHNRYPWKPEFYIMNRCGDPQYCSQISNRLYF